MSHHRARCSFTTRVPPCCERCSRSTRGEVVNEQYTQQCVLPSVPSQTGNGQMGQLSQKGEGEMGRDKRSAPASPREWLLIDMRKRTTPFEGLLMRKPAFWRVILLSRMIDRPVLFYLLTGEREKV